MSILIICNNKDPKPWADALTKLLPNEKIEIYPTVKNEKDIDFIVCWKPEKNIFKKYPNLKAIQSLGASVDHIFNSNKIGTNTQVARIIDPILAEDIWEYTLTATMNHIRRFNHYKYFQEKKTWVPFPYKNIKGTTVSILGLGNIGGYVAKKFASMGFKVSGWSTTKKKIPNVKSFTGKEGLFNVLKDADVIINILPLTKLTKGILNRVTLAKAENDPYIINVGRGEHIDEKTLLKRLNNFRVSGACLDVFNVEPLPKEHPFWDNPDIRITPHIAALTNIETAIGQIVENYYRLKKKKKLLNTVSQKKGY
ncbi:MAG: glyoxylate/hydroxypyruvate reductase A [Flavobacterium sp.]|nr:glyoxylate/hydroxypyruvate reductase A [Flavobacterium sp.]